MKTLLMFIGVMTLTVTVMAKPSSLSNNENFKTMLKRLMEDEKRDDSSEEVNTNGWIELFDGCYFPPSFPVTLVQDPLIKMTISFDKDSANNLQNEIDSLNLEQKYLAKFGKPTTSNTVKWWNGCIVNQQVAQNIGPYLKDLVNPCDDEDSDEDSSKRESDDDSMALSLVRKYLSNTMEDLVR